MGSVAEEEARLSAEGVYGMQGELRQVLAEHYPQLNHPTRVYMDYAGGAVPSQVVVMQGAQDVTSVAWSNPHSTGDLASHWDPSPRIAAVRAAILRMLDAVDDYDVVLTNNATHGLRLVSESLSWNRDGALLHAFEAHNSLLGIRDVALAAGAHVQTFSFYTEASVDHLEKCMRSVPSRSGAASTRLLAMPLACNVTGRYAHAEEVASVVRVADEAQWLVLLDAAGAVGKLPVSMQALGRPHMLVFSLFKALGWPHMGALLVRRDVAPRLRRTYFGGGTVHAVSATPGGLRMDRDVLHERLEDGTMPYLTAMQALPAIALVHTRLRPERIHAHVLLLWRTLRARLDALRHPSGAPLVRFHRPVPSETLDEEAARQTGVLCLTFLRPDGSAVPLDEVAERAVAGGMQVRVGGFCNPGAMERVVGVPPERALLAAQLGARCGLGAAAAQMPTTATQLLGAVRLSLGFASTLCDVVRLVTWAHASFALTTPAVPAALCPLPDAHTHSLRLSQVLLYPVKSAAAYAPTDPWAVLATGLLYDRDWMVIERAPALRPVSQKLLPTLALLQPVIDISANALTLSHPNAPTPLTLPLALPPPASSPALHPTATESDVLMLKSGASVQSCGADADAWLACLAPNLALVRRAASHARTARNRTMPAMRATSAPLSLANESQFLVVCEPSVADLNMRLASLPEPTAVTASRFRPNLVLQGGVPYQEDHWRTLHIGELRLRCMGSCGRCTMINVDPATAAMSTEPLNTLSSYRRSPNGSVLFGAHFMREAGEELSIEVGMPVLATTNRSAP